MSSQERKQRRTKHLMAGQRKKRYDLGMTACTSLIQLDLTDPFIYSDDSGSCFWYTKAYFSVCKKHSHLHFLPPLPSVETSQSFPEHRGTLTRRFHGRGKILPRLRRCHQAHLARIYRSPNTYVLTPSMVSMSTENWSGIWGSFLL